MESKREPNEPEPVDRKNIVLIILIIHGIGTLLPWNMFITADSYFNQKLTINEPIVNGTTITGTTTNGTIYKSVPYIKDLMNYITISSKLPNVVIQAVNFLIQPKNRSLTNRILVSIMIEAVIFFMTAILAIVDSSNWPGGFFTVTILSVILINVANGIYQNCVFGVTATLPMKYTNAVVTGMNVSGVVTSLIMIISTASTPDPMTSALAYFMTAVFFLFICFGTYIYLGNNEYFKQSYSNQIQKDRSESAQTMVTVGRRGRWREYVEIVKEIWPQLFNVFFTYFVSLSLFPSVLVVTDSTSGSLGIYWSVIVCFLSFNFCAMIGNLLIDFKRKIPPNRLWILTVSRILFIPFFLFCNAKPRDRTWTVLFPQDWVYATGVALMALTSGYTSSLAMVYAPLSVSDPANASTAGMMASFSLMIGIMSGILFSNVLTYIITI